MKNELHIDLTELGLKESIKEDERIETRKYEITGNPYQIEVLEQLLRYIEYLGIVGSSREIKVYCDGDGPVQLKITNNDEKIDMVQDLPVKIGYGIIKKDDENDSRFFDLG